MAESARQAFLHANDHPNGDNCWEVDNTERITWDGVTFKVLGNGASRQALLGPDNVVYKIPMHPQDYPNINHSQAKQEIALFKNLSKIGVAWCPDYCDYPNGVVAMKHYICPPETSFSDLQEIMEQMWLVNDDVSTWNIGQDPDTGQVVLIDGGVSSPEELVDWSKLK